MKALLLECAIAAGADAEDTEPLEKIIEEATFAQRSVVEDIIDSKLVDEEPFLENLAGKLGLPWAGEVKPRRTRKLKEACGAKIALRYRLLPVALGDADIARIGHEDDDELAPPALEEGGAVVEIADAAPEEEDDAADAPLAIATYDPFNLVSRQGAAQKIGRPVRWVIASRANVLKASRSSMEWAPIPSSRSSPVATSEASMDMKEETTILDDDDDEASVVKFVNQILREALEQRATDIHVEPLEHSLRIRYRIDGLLHEIAVPENIKSLQDMVIARLKIMSRLRYRRAPPPPGRTHRPRTRRRRHRRRVATVPT